MPKLKTLSGKQIIAILMQFGFRVASQKGSHIKLLRMKDEHKQTLTIPNHAELDTGTCKAILRQASRYIPVEELLPYFYEQ